MSRSRCVCGRSKSLPLCDGSHQSESWSCEGGEAARSLILSAPSERSLAQRLAPRLGATLDDPKQHRCQELLVLASGAGLAALRERALALRPVRLRVIGLGCSESLLRALFPGASVRCLPQAPLTQQWRLILQLCEQPDLEVQAAPLPRIFLSHASQDEALLEPALRALRQAGTEIFLCADSLRPGQAWMEQLLRELRSCDLFFYVSSEAASGSGFCAFECGMARALLKPMRLLLLDETPLPAWLQELQGVEWLRLQRRCPWLSPEEALEEALWMLFQES